MIGGLKRPYECGERALNKRYDICLFGFIAFSLLFGNTSGLSAPVISKEHVELLAGPKGVISFETKKLDFGERFRGESIDLSFNFKNIGEGPLYIRGIHSTCGCVVSGGLVHKTYGPGEKGSINVSVDTTRFEGDFRKTIVVLTNQSKRNSHELIVKGFLKSELTVDPPIVNLDADIINTAGEDNVHQVRLSSVDPKSFSILDIEFEKKLFDVSYNHEPKTQQWLVSIKPKSASKASALKSSIIIKNNTKHLSELTIPIHLHPSASVASSPDYVEFGALSKRKESKKLIALTGEKSFNIIGQKAKLLVNGSLIDHPERYLSVTVRNTSQANRKDLEVKLLRENKAIRGSVHGRFLFELDHPDQSHVSVDFYAHFGD